MSTSVRSYLTAGIAAFGAGAIALTPVAPVGADPAQRIADLAVSLTAAVTPVDPIQNIENILNSTVANLETLIADWSGGLQVNGTIPFPANNALNGFLGWRTGGYASGVPLPILQQVFTNLATYAGELPDIGTVINQVFGNITNALGAPFAAGTEENASPLAPVPLPPDFYEPFNQNVNAVPYINNVPLIGTASQRDVWGLLPTLAGDSYAALAPILNAATTPISGLLVGAIGPIVAPVLAVVNGLSNAIALLQEDNLGGAITELINIPANTVGAFLNGGQILDLTPVLSLAGITLPDSVTSIGLQMGGLLSPGGVALDALAADASLGGLDISIPGLPVGPIGALVSLTNYVAKSIEVTPPAAEETPAAVASAAAAPAAAAAAADPADTVAAEPVADSVAADDEAAPVAADPVAADDEAAPAAEAAEAAEVTDARAQTAAGADTAASEDTADREAPRASRSVRGPSASSAADADGPAPKRAARSSARTR